MFSKEILAVTKVNWCISQNKWKISFHLKKYIKESFETFHFSAKSYFILYFWTWNSINGLTSVHVNTKCREKFCQLTFARVVELEAKTQWVQSLFHIAFACGIHPAVQSAISEQQWVTGFHCVWSVAGWLIVDGNLSLSRPILSVTYGTPQGTPTVQSQIMMIPIKFGNINSTSLESRSWLWKIYST